MHYTALGGMHCGPSCSQASCSSPATRRLAMSSGYLVSTALQTSALRDNMHEPSRFSAMACTIGRPSKFATTRSNCGDSGRGAGQLVLPLTAVVIVGVLFLPNDTVHKGEERLNDWDAQLELVPHGRCHPAAPLEPPALSVECVAEHWPHER